MFDTKAPENLEQIPPGPELARVLAALRYDSLSPHDLVRVLRAQQRQVAHYQAASYWTMDQIVTAYQSPDDLEDAFDLNRAVDGAAAEISAALHLTRQSGEYETGMAVDLNRRLPQVLDALLCGDIDVRRARVMVAATSHVSEAIAQGAVDMVIEDASGLTTGQLRARLRKLCIDADPATAHDLYEMYLEDRRLVLEANDTGTANLMGMDLPPHVAASIKTWIHREAIKLKKLGDTRTMDQLRADIYTDLLRRRYKAGKATRAGFGVLTLTGTAESFTGQSRESVELHGFGPVFSEIAQEVAEHHENAELRWNTVDPATGLPIDGGIVRRHPTRAQRRQVEALHRTCIHPGCRMAAVDCDLDHTVPWEKQKLTCTSQLGPMCRHHHVIRHTFGWDYQLVHTARWGGDFIFTSPFGHHYTTSGKQPVSARGP